MHHTLILDPMTRACLMRLDRSQIKRFDVALKHRALLWIVCVRQCRRQRRRDTCHQRGIITASDGEALARKSMLTAEGAHGVAGRCVVGGGRDGGGEEYGVALPVL